jgi:hypothetical protein
MKKDRPQSQTIAGGNPYDLSAGRSDAEVRAALRQRRDTLSPEVEDVARRVREAETLTAADLAVVINALPE